LFPRPAGVATRRPSVGSSLAESAAAWPKHSAEDRDYLSVKLDHPRFNAAIFATRFGEYNLIGSRGPGRTLIRPARANSPVRAIRAGRLSFFFNRRLAASQASAALYSVTNLPQARSASAMS
jgi:hypothetical protein